VLKSLKKHGTFTWKNETLLSFCLCRVIALDPTLV